MIHCFHPDRKSSKDRKEQKRLGQGLSISAHSLKVMKSYPHRSMEYFDLGGPGLPSEHVGSP